MRHHPEPALSLGPILYLWNPIEWRDFYFRIADEAPIDHVTIGEVVCSKRQHFPLPYIDEVVERLQSGGKTVKLATLALSTIEREQRATRALAEQNDLEVEVNDLAALHHLANRRYTVGPLINVYNGATARFLAARGAESICLPPELTMESVRTIVASTPGIAFEVFAFGRVPLALSARCAHARAKGVGKYNCRFVCGEDPDGLRVETLDKQAFLALNGVQTLSHTCQTSILDIPTLRDAGVARFRLSPQRCDMVAVAKVYSDILAGRVEPLAGLEALRQIYPQVPFSNGFLHGLPGAEMTIPKEIAAPRTTRQRRDRSPDISSR